MIISAPFALPRVLPDGNYLSLWGYIAKTSAYTITSDDFTVDCNGTFTVTLPDSTSLRGRVFVIKNSGGGVITVNTTSSQTIDESLTLTLIPGVCYRVQSTGAHYIII